MMKTNTVEWLIFLQLAFILAAARLGAWIGTKWLGQTAVAGEILAGIFLGPAVGAKVSPFLYQTIFPSSSFATLKQFGEFGLILLMFQVGLEFDVKRALDTHRRTVIGIAVAAAIVPFVIGYIAAISYFDGPSHDARLAPFRLFFALALSITAIPILGRIFSELQMTNSAVACIAIGAAAMEDVVGWFSLSVITAYATETIDKSALLARLALLFSLLLSIIIFAPRLRRWIGSISDDKSKNTAITLPFLCIALMLCSAATAFLGVFGIIGAFTLGFSLQGDIELQDMWHANVGKFSNMLFVPIFFVTTGLRLQIDSIASWHVVKDVTEIIILAFIGKFLSTYFVSRMFGQKREDAFILGVSMNTRALMELIILNIALDLHIFTTKIFTYLVLMAIASTFVATPLIRLALRVRKKSAASVILAN